MWTSSRSLIHRLVPYFSTRLRYNSRLLSSSSALHEPQLSSVETPSPAIDVVHMTDDCVRRMKELQTGEANEKVLRLSIEAGGCSGFQYNFSLDDKTNDDDRIFERDGVKLVVDNISFDFVKGSTVDYVEELIRAAFQVSANPSAVGGCSCKSSFMTNYIGCDVGTLSDPLVTHPFLIEERATNQVNESQYLPTNSLKEMEAKFRTDEFFIKVPNQPFDFILIPGINFSNTML